MSERGNGRAGGARTHVAILCSGISLGHYNPALLMREELRRRGISFKVYVLECYLDEERVRRIGETKAAFHRSFAFALTAQRIAKHLWPTLSPEVTARLTREWRAQAFTHVISVSGFWFPVVAEFTQEVGTQAPQVDFCHLDSADSTSWRIADARRGRHVWLWSAAEGRVIRQIPVAPRECPPVPYSERPDEVIVHGGGWGIGTYQSTVDELLAHGIRPVVNAYEDAELKSPERDVRYFLTDPSWLPWAADEAGEFEFPPIAEIDAGGEVEKRRGVHYHPMYDIVRRTRAIISKPGGGTLLDSLASGTPLITLDPYGPYESQNAQLWERLGLGMPISRWRELGFSFEPLEALAENLNRLRESTPAYPDFI